LRGDDGLINLQKLDPQHALPDQSPCRTLFAMLAWFRRHRRRLVIGGLFLAIGLPMALVLVFRFLPPLTTPLMLIRRLGGEGIERRWVSLDAMSPNLFRAVIAAEDAKFCQHHGFDWDAIDRAVDRYEDGGRVLGASTISMQTAKNVFLWPDRTFLRKGLEAYLTVLIEQIWGKRRILEVYLNVVEWGHGLYGAEAAALAYFHHPAATLTQREAAALAAVLPSPRRWSAVHPSGHVLARMRMIEARMGSVSPRICP
jgi:monofunctional biosynthetic peptidoglycan transglycosylase